MTDATSGLLTPGTLDLFSQKTRDKILAASLVLFNQRGFGAVTTASIAEQAGILEGTLWYHFRAKKDILSAHIALLQTVFAQENTKADSSDPETIIDGIFRSYDVIWDFRYLLRDDFNALLNRKTTCSSPSKASTTFSTSGRKVACFTRPTMAFSPLTRTIQVPSPRSFSCWADTGWISPTRNTPRPRASHLARSQGAQPHFHGSPPLPVDSCLRAD